MRRTLILALLLAAAVAAPARADYVIEGRGWGHGVGMSQYGAYGYALNEGRDFRFIIGHYYTGTAVSRVAPSRIRVLLRRTRTPKLCGATLLRAAGGRKLKLRATRTYKLSPWGPGGLNVIDTSNGHRRARVRAPVRVTGGATTCVRGAAENGVNGGSYRGALRLHRDRGATLVVNDLSLESYLQGVVASEMPASWPAEALKAQAVVARSYALRSLRTGERYDVFADTRSQMYKGAAGEVAAATAARAATRASRSAPAARSRRRSSTRPRAARRRATRRASAAARRCPTCGQSTTRTTRCRPSTPGPSRSTTATPSASSPRCARATSTG